MLTYNPFGKPLESITADDLNALKGLRESWHCDFKKGVERDLPKQAKFLASFANSFGGWLFYGVDQERGTGDAVALTFPGIADSEAPDALLLLRNAVAQHVAPPCYYHARVISGPAPAVGLPAKRSVLCVYIPRGEAPPYVDKSGRVYRRIGDSSEPGYENDRTALDRLWAVRRSKELAFRDELCSAGSNDARRTETAVLHLFATETPGGEAIRPRFMWAGFKEIMSTRDSSAEPTAIILPSVHCDGPG